MTPRELSWRVERLVSKESWVEQGDFLPLNVTYQLLAGAPSPQQSESVREPRSVCRLDQKSSATSLLYSQIYCTCIKWFVLCDKIFRVIK